MTLKPRSRRRSRSAGLGGRRERRYLGVAGEIDSAKDHDSARRVNEVPPGDPERSLALIGAEATGVESMDFVKVVSCQGAREAGASGREKGEQDAQDEFDRDDRIDPALPHRRDSL